MLEDPFAAVGIQHPQDSGLTKVSMAALNLENAWGRLGIFYF